MGAWHSVTKGRGGRNNRLLKPHHSMKDVKYAKENLQKPETLGCNVHLCLNQRKYGWRQKGTMLSLEVCSYLIKIVILPFILCSGVLFILGFLTFFPSNFWFLVQVQTQTHISARQWPKAISTSTIKELQDKQMKVSKCPPLSPDKNIVEYLWKNLKKCHAWKK